MLINWIKTSLKFINAVDSTAEMLLPKLLSTFRTKSFISGFVSKLSDLCFTREVLLKKYNWDV